jgi:hypothetical protein
VLTIAGRQVTVSQAAGSCVTLVNPGGVDYTAEFQQGTATVTASSGCQWTATTTAPSFIVLPTFGASGAGSGSFIYKVFGNLSGASRSGSINVGGLTLNVNQHAPLGRNTLTFVSDAGDYIGQGWTFLLEQPYASFTSTLDASHNHLSLRGVGSDGLSTQDWTLDLAAPQGQQLKTGTFVNATRYPFQAPTVPGLSFSGDGRGCNLLSGQFTITDVVFGTDGTVQRLAVSFEQHCEGAGPALRGNVSYVR